MRADAGGGGGASASGFAAGADGPCRQQQVFSLSLIRQDREAIQKATVQELWIMAQDYLLTPRPSRRTSSGAGAGSALDDPGFAAPSHARERRSSGARGLRATEKRKVELLEAELAAKMGQLQLLQQQRSWLAVREAVLNDLMRVNQSSGAQPQQGQQQQQQQQGEQQQQERQQDLSMSQQESDEAGQAARAAMPEARGAPSSPDDRGAAAAFALAAAATEAAGLGPPLPPDAWAAAAAQARGGADGKEEGAADARGLRARGVDKTAALVQASLAGIAADP
jgi:hypothetical protein